MVPRVSVNAGSWPDSAQRPFLLRSTGPAGPRRSHREAHPSSARLQTVPMNLARGTRPSGPAASPLRTCESRECSTGAKSDIHTGALGVGGVRRAQSPPACSSLATQPGENRVPDERCLDSNKHLRGLSGVYKLPAQCPAVSGGRNRLSVTAGNQGSEREAIRLRGQSKSATLSTPPSAELSHPPQLPGRTGGTHEHVPHRPTLPQFPVSSAAAGRPRVSQQPSARRQLLLYRAGLVPTPSNCTPGLSPLWSRLHLAHHSCSGQRVNTLNKQECHYHREPAARQVCVPSLPECPRARFTAQEMKAQRGETICPASGWQKSHWASWHVPRAPPPPLAVGTLWRGLCLPRWARRPSASPSRGVAPAPSPGALAGLGAAWV